MNKKIAIPMENGVLCSHFGHCQNFAIVTVKDNKIINIEEVIPPDHKPGLYPRWIASLQVTDIIAGGIGQKAIQLFNQQNINVFVGGSIKTAKQIVEDYIAGNLSLSANFCNHNGSNTHNCQR